MSITRKLTLRTLKKNPKRTLVTIVGIILATALITAVANLAESFRSSMIIYERQTGGDYHVCFYGVMPEDLKYFENNVGFARTSVVGEMGYARFEDSKNPDKPYLYLLSMDEDGRATTALKLNTGRWPENESEIVISSHMRTNGGSRLVVGDTLTLTMGKRVLGEGTIPYQNCSYQGEGESFIPSEERQYTVVGIMQRPGFNIEPYIAPGYTAVTCVSDPAAPATVYASYTRKALLRYMGNIEASLSPYAREHSVNTTLLRWELGYISSNTMEIIYAMGAIALVIIIITSVFCIRNSFQISLTEKMRLYGMLSSVGTTAKQRRRMVYCEAFYLGVIGIPLGIGGGVLATFILIKTCSELVRYVVDMKLYYKFSLPAVIAGTVLSGVTIFMSASQSARKASKISPISAIRSNDTIRRGKRKLRTPRLLRWIFGIGGTLAYKNLRRSKVKYRTTVISIVVSVAVFIAMTTFVRLGFKLGARQSTAGSYPIVVSLLDPEREDQARQICSWEEVQRPLVQRQAYPVEARAEQIRATQESHVLSELGWTFKVLNAEQNEVYHLQIYALGENAYEEYCRKVGVTAAEAAQGAIMYAEYRAGMDDGSGMKYYEGTIAEFEKGDILDLSVSRAVAGSEQETDGAEAAVLKKNFSLPVVCQTKVLPDFLRNWDNHRILCIVSDAWLDENLSDFLYPQLNLYIQCEDADAMETRIRNDMPLYSYYVSNYERAVREENGFWLLLAIFLYGFIAVIALIGVTNIFNTVTTNMELRSREFAMLRSIGMTGREFRRMIQLESLFYGGGALCIGIPVGCVLSRLFYLVFDVNTETAYEWPLSGIGISIAAVFLLLLVIMRYSMGKIQKKNVIETIQNENI